MNPLLLPHIASLPACLAAAMNSTDRIESVFDAVMYDKGEGLQGSAHMWRQRTVHTKRG